MCAHACIHTCIEPDENHSYSLKPSTKPLLAIFKADFARMQTRNIVMPMHSLMLVRLTRTEACIMGIVLCQRGHGTYTLDGLTETPVLSHKPLTIQYTTHLLLHCQLAPRQAVRIVAERHILTFSAWALDYLRVAFSLLSFSEFCFLGAKNS